MPCDSVIISAGKRKKRSRWGAKDDLEFIPGMPVTLPPNLTEEQQRLYLSKSFNFKRHFQFKASRQSTSVLWTAVNQILTPNQ